MSYDGLHDVDMSEFSFNAEGGQGLVTLALFTCVGIAVTVDYAGEARQGQPRPDKFLAHIDEEDGEEAAAALVQHVDEAKQRDIRSLHVVACVLNPESLRERPEEPVDEATMQRQVNLNEHCITMASRFTDGVRSSAFLLVKHHVYEPRNMIITAANEIRIDSYDWDPDQRGRRSFRGFPDQLQLSSATRVVNQSSS
ncbi:hypothetical protein Daus18300_012041 [Diaporthe australafricana]|uniref:Protein kinase domain-containing protein n=1 Tax=Diaporthe australafricana TaxID=127596 RepID=A0ABR3W459_9PEZI